VHAGVVASGDYIQKYPHTLKAVLRALKRATDTINQERDKVVPIVAKEMRIREELTRDIMALNIYSITWIGIPPRVLWTIRVLGQASCVNIANTPHRVCIKPGRGSCLWRVLT
jgi:hypothetical protein